MQGDRLTNAELEFLIECAQNCRMTSCTGLNGELVERTGLPGFGFQRAVERATKRHLLALIVERDHPVTGLMLSALVHCRGTNETGSSFYGFAVQLGLLPTGASRATEEFWMGQARALHDHCAPGRSVNGLIPRQPARCRRRPIDSSSPDLVAIGHLDS